MMGSRKRDGAPTALGDDPFAGMEAGAWMEGTEKPESEAVEGAKGRPEVAESAEPQAGPTLTAPPSTEGGERLTLELLVAEAKMAAGREASSQRAEPSAALAEEPEETLLFSWLVTQAPRLPPSLEEDEGTSGREGPQQILSRLDAWLDAES